MPKGGRQATFGDKCKDCGVELTLQNACYVRYRLRPNCKDCYNEWARNYRQERFKDPEKRAAYNAWVRESRKDPEVLAKHKEGMKKVHLRNTYGITQENYDKLVELHQGGCAICRKPCETHERLSVDHDHITGKVRGLLCQKCNTAIAMLNEDEDLFWQAMEYLKKYRTEVA